MKREDALDYHARGRPGKIAVVPTKPLANQRDLALAYTPGVAEPCLEIQTNPDDAYRYTAKGNLVAVVTNGTAVLGLGNIGALAGKPPVMEGKATLFKQFADIDCFDIEVGSELPDDVIRFVGLSVARAIKPEMLRAMAEQPIIFALANPVPEVLPAEVRAVRPDAIMATGRSDYPNQMNNVLGFPFIFRGALDERARTVNEEMKMAATRALAELAKEDVPDSLAQLYGLRDVSFGRDYLIPFPFDPRVLLWVAPAVAWAAVASGAAPGFIDVDRYREELEERLGRAARADRLRRVAHRANVRDHAAGGDALVLELRLGAPPRVGEGGARSAARAPARPLGDDRRGDAGRHRARRGHAS